MLAGALATSCGARTALEGGPPLDRDGGDTPDVAGDRPSDGGDADVARGVDTATDVPRGGDDAADGAVSSRCRAAAEPLLVVGEHSPGGIAVDGTHVYWTTGVNDGLPGQIRSMPTEGGPVVTLADGQPNPWALVTDAASVYWYNIYHVAHLRRVPLRGGPIREYPITVTALPGRSAVLGADSQNLYFNDIWSLLGVPKAGGAQRVIHDGHHAAFLVADDDGLYWQGVLRAPPGTDPTTTLTLFAYPRGAAAPTLLARNARGPIALDRTWVYFVTASARDMMIQRIPRNGGPRETIVGAIEGGPSHLAVDDVALYWVEGSRDGRRFILHRTPKSGGADAILTQGDGRIGGLAVDARCVYWTNSTTNTVGRVAHPGG